MIKEYEKQLAEKTNKLTARLAAAKVRKLAMHAKEMERRVKQRQPDFRMTWRSVTTGLILGFFEYEGVKIDNTYHYLNELSSAIIDFFEYLREAHGYEKENPATEAQKILFDPKEIRYIRWNAQESYRLFDEALQKAGNVRASTYRKPARTETMSETEAAMSTERAKKTRQRQAV